ncbi:MAG TPA: hypothetical protein VFZ65_07565 [Planctomycetota bacterium]|nr:hypothetical protein [Planctomycetota bacterium]
MRRPIRPFSLCALLLGLLACRATPPRPLELPAVSPTVRYAGSGGEAAGGAGRAVCCDVFAVAEAPAGASIEQSASVIASDHGDPFRGVSHLPAGTVWLDAEATEAWLAAPDAAAPERRQHLGRVDAVAGPGLVATIGSGLPSMPELRLECRGDATAVLLVVHTEPAHDDPDHPGGDQYVLLRDALPDGASCLCFVPSSDRGVAGYALVLGSPGAAPAAAVAAAVADAARADDDDALTAAARQQRLAARAVGGFNRRAAMLGIAEQIASPRALDLLLSADEAHLIAIGTATATVDSTAPDYAWRFERAAWLALIPGMQRDELTPALHACMQRHFGALGSDATMLEMHLNGSPDAPSFDAAVREENLAALDDSAAAIRARAHDWLTARALAVPGYAPLDGKQVRREALRRHEREAAAGLGQEHAR